MNRIHPHVAGLAFLAAMLLAGCGKKEEAPPAAPQFTPTPAPPVVQAAKSAPEEDAGFQVIATSRPMPRPASISTPRRLP